VTYIRLCRNEIVKVLRHRWWLFLAVFALLVLMVNAPILQSLARDGKLPRFGQKFEWRAATVAQQKTAEATVRQLQASRAQVVKQLGGGSSTAGYRRQLDQQISLAQEHADMYRLMLQRDSPPADIEPIVAGSILVFSLIGFLFVIVLSWLAAESIAGERSSRTLGLLLMRPIRRGTLLAAKATSVAVAALTLLVVTLVLAVAYTQLYAGSLGDFGSNVAVLRDSGAAASASNLVILPLAVLLLLALGGALAGLACAGAMAMAISVFAGRSGAAVGITLGVIFGGPILASGINAFLSLASGKAADWLNYLWFENFLPAGKLLAIFNNDPNAFTGSTPFFRSVGVASGWTALFIVFGYIHLRRLQEAG